MKKFAVVAVMALGVISISGAFAGNNNIAAAASMADSTDTVAPQNPDTASAIALNDTVVPADTVASPADTAKFGLAANDTVVPADTTKSDSLRF